jgi:CheY-like chemotaxis protein
LLRFEVQDTGVGIAPDEMERLFEPFVQTRSGQAVGEGTGLGLSISQQYMHLIGGEIHVDSRVGAGSNFSFVIPVQLVSAARLEPQRPSRRVIGLVPGQPQFRILVVDDSSDNRALLQELLEDIGFEVQTAEGGQKAVEIYRSWHPHLIWMDIRMPGLDGYQATRLIKDSHGPETIVIAVTASAFEEERARVLEAGCDDFLRKPFSEADIYELMAKYLELQYVYEDLKPPVAAETAIFTPTDLADLPDDWVTELRQAASRGRTQELFSLIEQIDEPHHQLATTLQAMVSNYEFKQILDLTERRGTNGLC